MKKTYINPTLEVVKINTNNQLLAGSVMQSKGNFGDGTGITLGSREFDDDDSFFYE